MYVVQLVKPIPALRNPYADNYFPRHGEFMDRELQDRRRKK
jgi:hypothetical protein